MKKFLKIFYVFPVIIFISFANYSVVSAQTNEIRKSIDQVYLRVELATSSDWTIFKWETIPEIVTMKVFAVDGANTDYQVFYDRIKLAQKKNSNLSKVKIFVDYLLKTKPTENWKFSIRRGQIGETEVKIKIKNQFLFEEIYSFNHNNIIENDRAENKVFSSFVFNFKPEYNFVPEKIDVIKIPKLLLAFYYLWYTKDNWKVFPLVDRPESYYSSSDMKIMQRQIELAIANGIDGFITSWDGPQTLSDKNFQIFLNQCEKLNFKTSIYYETLKEDGPRSDDEIYNSLKFIIEHYGNHKSFIRIFNKPLIFIWASNEVDISRWRNIIRRLKVANLDATFIAMGYDITNLHLFDGLHQYGVILIDDLEKEFKTLSSIVKNYHLIGDRQKIWTATVQPGYDERKIPKRPGFYKDRRKGKYYEETWKAALASNPDLILITSWNEWWEHTHIEPSKSHKNFYLEITKKYSKLWKRD